MMAGAPGRGPAGGCRLGSTMPQAAGRSALAWGQRGVRSTSSSSAAAIVSGVGGQPGIRRSTGSTVSTGPTRASGVPRRLTAEGTVAERSDQTRLRHRLVGGEERLAHAGGDRPGHEQQVGVPRRRDDAEPEPLEVVVRARDEGQLVLAPVAGARIDVTDREAAAAIGPREGSGSAKSSEVAKKGQHQRSVQA